MLTSPQPLSDRSRAEGRTAATRNPSDYPRRDPELRASQFPAAAMPATRSDHLALHACRLSGIAEGFASEFRRVIDMRV